MSDHFDDISTELKLYGMGKRFRAGHAQAGPPMGDRMIKAVRSVLWEAWEMGKDSPGNSYPSVPLLDQLTSKPSEPEEQAINYGVALGGARKEKLPKRWRNPNQEIGKESDEPGEPVEPVEPSWEPEL